MRKVPLCIPAIDEAEIAAVTEVLRSGWLAHGPGNHAFEEAFAEYLGVEHCLTMNSCATALFLALYASGIEGEVILPSFTMVASANAVVTAGATPIFVDVRYDTCNLDPAALEAAITPRTEAIMPVHYAGQLAEMDRIREIAEKHGLLIVEDSAETLGGEYKGRRSGAWGIGCFSFFPTKNITTGEGGMLTSRNADFARKARAIVGHGIDSTTFSREKQEKPWIRAATFAGFNFRMSNLLAAIGVEQMKKLENLNALRRKHAETYNKMLNPEFFDLPVERPGFKHVYQMYTAKLKLGSRTAFLKQLREHGVGASVHFDPPVHTQPYYVELAPRSWDLPVTERLAERIFTLPMYPQMSVEDLAYVAEHANRAAATVIGVA